MAAGYDLAKLSSKTFERLVNTLVMKVLGPGLTTFGPGPDGGRDGLFQGSADYPSSVTRWTGTWYIQSKFHEPNLTSDAESWLRSQIKTEIEDFLNPRKRRVWPDNWIVATNVQVSGMSETGTWDAAVSMVRTAQPDLAERFHIWSATKIEALLILNPEIAAAYRHFLTPGHVVTEILNSMGLERVSTERIVRSLTVGPILDQRRAKLEAAGARGYESPGVHELFVDLPYLSQSHGCGGPVLEALMLASSGSLRVDPVFASEEWREWRLHPHRARVWFIKAGPGRGKSTVTQYFAQIQRAAILAQNEMRVSPEQRELAAEIRRRAIAMNLWPSTPRIPIYIELRNYAQWYTDRAKVGTPLLGVLNYVAHAAALQTDQEISAGALRSAMAFQAWAVIFDGLDEVPTELRTTIAQQVNRFITDVSLDINSDLLAICTSRPQGYSGQFNDIEHADIYLRDLEPDEAHACVLPVIRLGRSSAEAEKTELILKESLAKPAVQNIMKTPLQAHIIGIIIRDNEQPPEKQWQLYNKFYEVIYRREQTRDLIDSRLRKVLQEKAELLTAIHSTLGFILHVRSETSGGAAAQLDSTEFHSLVHYIAETLHDDEVAEIVEPVLEAAKDRLVLVNTPDDGKHVRFDIRQFQEFFAAEFLISDLVGSDKPEQKLKSRLEIVASDSHWFEVVHFVLSRIIAERNWSAINVVKHVLQEANGDGLEGPQQFICSRTAFGARVVARVLAEGGFDSNKQVRDAFNLALGGIRRLTDTALFSTDIREGYATLRPSTQKWLVCQMKHHFFDADFSGSIGAALAVCLHTDGTEDDFGHFIDRLLSAPSSYIYYLLVRLNQYVFRRARRKTEKASEERVGRSWWRVLAAELLLREHDEDWRLSHIAWECLRSFPLADEVPFVPSPKMQLNAASQFLPPTASVENDSTQHTFGAITVQVFSYRHLTNVSELKLSFWENSEMGAGTIFDTVKAGAEYLLAPSKEAYMAFMRALVEGRPGIAARFPWHCYCIPAPRSSADYKALLALLETENGDNVFDEVLKGGACHDVEMNRVNGVWIDRVTISGTLDAASLVKAFSAFPDGMLLRIGRTRPLADAVAAVVEESPEYESLVGIICKAVATLSHPHYFISMMLVLLELKEPMLSRVICAYAEAIQDELDVGDAHYAAVVPDRVQSVGDLNIDFIKYSGLVVGLASWICEVGSSALQFEQGGVLSVRSFVSRLLPLSTIDVLLNDEQSKLSVRIASFILGVVHADGGEKFLCHHSRFAERHIYPAGTGGLMLARAVGIVSSVTDGFWTGILMKLYEGDRQNSVRHEFVEHVIARWSNYSNEPATRAGAVDKWVYRRDC